MVQGNETGNQGCSHHSSDHRRGDSAFDTTFMPGGGHQDEPIFAGKKFRKEDADEVAEYGCIRVNTAYESVDCDGD